MALTMFTVLTKPIHFYYHTFMPHSLQSSDIVHWMTGRTSCFNISKASALENYMTPNLE